jgi:hypothetical protein
MYEEEEPMTYGWMFVIVVFIIILFIVTITVVAVSVSQYNASLPSEVDIVIMETSKGIIVPQLLAINQHMGFRRNIYILTTSNASGPAFLNIVSNTYYVAYDSKTVNPQDNINSNFMFQYQIKNIPTVPDIADHAIFLADQTIPFQNVSKSLFYFGNRPRMFNIFRNDAETTYLSSFYNYTAPALIANLSILSNSSSVTDFVLFTISQERAVTRNEVNRDIFVNESTDYFAINTATQYTELNNNPPIFATFHDSGTNQTTADQNLLKFLNTQFS